MKLVAVYGASATRHRDRVHLVVSTSEGPATLIFSEPLAKSIGRELALAAIPVVGQHAAQAETRDQRPPILKPHGGIL